MLNEKLKGCIKLIKKLGPQEKSELFSLMTRHYNDVNENKFLHDLSDKHHIILFYDKKLNQLRGFTTLKILQLNTYDEHVCLFSGDTIIEKGYWGSVQLPRLWCVYINAIKEWYPGKKIYWLLTAKGYKTYRFMSVFFCDYYPHYNKNLSYLKELLDSYAFFQFQERYDLKTHLIDNGKIKDRLKPGVADIKHEHDQDASVKFFIESNPDWVKGTELASILEVTEDNLTLLGKRMFKQAYRQPEFVEN
ncbi:MAG TPA: hypothetical protein VL201_01060, partial [Patescibacteria group bacterium]|nr:hypothetical protein [Patescibacteria group bacterium]